MTDHCPGGGGVGVGEEGRGEELGRRRRRRSWGGGEGEGEEGAGKDRIPMWHFSALTSPIGGRVSPSCAVRSCPGDQGQLFTPPPKTEGHKFQIEGS